MLDALPIEDVNAIVRVLGAIAGSVDPLPVRKRQLLEGIARLAGADVWLWTQGHGRAPETPRAFSLIDGGYTEPEQRAAMVQVLNDADWDRLCQQPLTSVNGRPLADPPHITRTRNQLVSDDVWYGSTFYATRYAATDLDDCMLSVYPLGGDGWSAVGLWRRRGRPAFSDRERCVVHVLTSQIDWLHRAGSDAPAAPGVRDLSPREAQVLLLLLGGDGRKQIARRLGLSEHTVGDYMKALHRHFNVSSRGELLARFMSGDAAAAAATT